MNFIGPFDVEHAKKADPGARPTTKPRRRRGGRMAAFGLVLIGAAALASGAWSHYQQHRENVAAAEQQRDFVPEVRVATIEPSDTFQVVSLPATTSAFATANIFARASGYIGKR